MFTCGPAFFAAAAGGGGGSGHRYWRIKFHTTNDTGGGTMQVGEVELHTSIGGADVTGSGTASASYNNGTAGDAFDNNTSSHWDVASGNYPATLVYDFGAGNEKDIVEFAIYASDGPSAPRKFDLEWSDDNSAWTTLFEIAGETGWSSATTRTWSASTDPDLYRYWRMYVTANNGNAYVSLQSFEMRESISGADITDSANAIGNDAQFTLEPSRAFDRNTTTVWATNVFPGYVGQDFGASNAGWKTIVEWVLRADLAAQAPKTFKLQKSHDASSWTDVISPADQTGWSVGEERTFS
jgi:hypothetical protein